MAWQITCYLDARRRNPVEEFIQELPERERVLVRARIDFLAEVGNRIREPLSKSLGNGLFELRVKWSPTGKPVARFTTPVERNPEQESPVEARLESKGPRASSTALSPAA